MKQLAVDKARGRLAKAEAALERVKGSKDFAEFEAAWIDLLFALNGVPGSLEQGAKDNPKSRQWYGGRKKEARTDPLLAYLRQARNAEEHGIEPIAIRHPGGLRIDAGARPAFRFMPDANSKLGIRLQPIISPGITPIPSHPELVAVRDDRFAQTFDPPTSHLGTTLSDTQPVAIGYLGLRYYAALIEEAAGLVS